MKKTAFGNGVTNSLLDAVNRVLNESTDLSEVKKGSYVTHKESGAVGEVQGVSGDKSTADIKWNDSKSKHSPTQEIKFLSKLKESADDDDGWYAHNELHGKVSAKNWKSGWRYNSNKDKPYYHTKTKTWHGSIKEESENLEELSKETLRSYQSRAKSAIAPGSFGKGRLSNFQSQTKSKRIAGLQAAKDKLHKIISKENDAREAKYKSKVEDVHNHFQKEAPKLLKSHGYTKLHTTNGHSVYHKPHESGHSTMVRISHNPNKRDYDSYGSKFGVHSTSGSGTLMGHNHIVNHRDDADHHKRESVHNFASVLLSHDKDHKSSGLYNEEIELESELISLVEEATSDQLDQLDELSKKTLISYLPKAGARKKELEMKTRDHHDDAKSEDHYQKMGSPYTLTQLKDRFAKKIDSKSKGISMASKKLAKEDIDLEDFENMNVEEREEFLNSQIDELSNKTLTSYIKKAVPRSKDDHSEYSQNVKKGLETKNFKKYDKRANDALRNSDNREKGINRAVDKLNKDKS